jgi:hypothetical protein
MIAVAGEEKRKSIEDAFERSSISLTRVGQMSDDPYEPETDGPPLEELWALLKRTHV